MEDAERAIEANDGAALRDAIRRGADVNGMVPCTNKGSGELGFFPLLFMATARGLAGMCEILLAEGADTNIGSTDNGSVPLHCAAYHGCTACLRVLLRAGADANSRAHTDATPLHSACARGWLHAVKLLIAAVFTYLVDCRPKEVSAINTGNFYRILKCQKYSLSGTLLRRQVKNIIALKHDFSISYIVAFASGKYGR